MHYILKQNVRRKLAFKSKTSVGRIFALHKSVAWSIPPWSLQSPPPPSGLKFIHSSELSGRRHSDELVTACHSNTHCSKVACVHKEWIVGCFIALRLSAWRWHASAAVGLQCRQFLPVKRKQLKQDQYTRPASACTRSLLRTSTLCENARAMWLCFFF